MNTKDGRTTRGQLVRKHVRERIVNAYIELLRASILFPTATEIAERASHSRRVVFDHFADLSELRAAAFSRVEAKSRSFFAQQINRGLSAEQGLCAFMERQTTMF
jgi:hypothetical protein